MILNKSGGDLPVNQNAFCGIFFASLNKKDLS